MLTKTHKKSMITSTVLMLSVSSLLSLSACKSGDEAKNATPEKDAVAATVNGAKIKESVVNMLLKQATSQGQPDNADTRKMILDRLTMQAIIAQEAKKKGLDKAPDVVNQIEMAKQSILAQSFVRGYIEKTPITDAMLSEEYAKLKTQMASTEYKARHILVEKEEDAKDIIAKLQKDPKTFADLAQKKSMDPGSKASGGDLGWFDPRGMVPEFGTAVATLEKGKFTLAPVKTQFGYHVIFLDDSRVKEAPALDQIKAELKQKVQQQNVTKLLDDLKAKAKVEIVPVASASASASASAASASSSAKDTGASAPANK